jgi:hypothetical protein
MKHLIGKTITFWIPNGISITRQDNKIIRGMTSKKKSGRVVMAFDTHCVVNGGGRYGTPYVVDSDNFISEGRKP